MKNQNEYLFINKINILLHPKLKTKKMIKKLLSVAVAVTLCIGAKAQQIIKKTNNNPEVLTPSAGVLKQGNNSVSTSTCYTLTTITSSDTITLYTVPSSTAMPDGGYVTGNNGYGDITKATFIPGALVPAAGQITGVIAVFYQKSPTIGTHGAGTISVDILNGDTSAGPTGAAIATATASLATITTMSATNSQITYLFNLTTPVAAPSTGFFASLNLPTTTGDTAVLLCTKNKSNHHNYAWDKNGTTWLAFSSSSDWSLQTQLTLFPIVCAPTSIKTNVLETNVAYFPNPTAGEFNLAVALPKATNITISVANNLGQTVFSKVENNISNSVISCDFSSIGKGIYFVTITDSDNNKVVKKIVVE